MFANQKPIAPCRLYLRRRFNGLSSGNSCRCATANRCMGTHFGQTPRVFRVLACRTVKYRAVPQKLSHKWLRGRKARPPTPDATAPNRGAGKSIAASAQDDPMYETGANRLLKNRICQIPAHNLLRSDVVDPAFAGAPLVASVLFSAAC